jgi:hypothetical protein
MSANRNCALSFVLFAAVACASKQSAEAKSGSQATLRWTGNFKQAGSSAVLGSEMARARSSGYGSITVTPLDPRGRAKIELSINASTTGTQLAWAVFGGPCNAPTPPVISVNEFPPINVTNNGAGTVRTEIQMPLDSRSSYHANVYWSNRATDVSNVMMCANLAYSGAR